MKYLLLITLVIIQLCYGYPIDDEECTDFIYMYVIFTIVLYCCLDEDTDAFTDEFVVNEEILGKSFDCMYTIIMQYCTTGLLCS